MNRDWDRIDKAVISAPFIWWGSLVGGRVIIIAWDRLAVFIPSVVLDWIAVFIPYISWTGGNG